jgi:D-xylose transport system permease protein
MTGISTTKQPIDEPEESAADEAGRMTAPGGGLAEHLDTYVQRLRGGDMGSLPAVAGLVVLSLIFWAVHHPFGTLSNFAAVLEQSAPSIFIAMGLVFVLLIAEIDLSAGTAAGVCACLMARLSQGYNWPWPASIGAALVCGLALGLLTGWICAKVRIPSFVVTLALFLAYQGVVLYIVNNGAGMHGNITVGDNFINALDNSQMPVWAGWLMVAALLAGYAAVKAYDAGRRVRAGLAAEPLSLIGLKVLGLGIIAVVAVWLLNSNRADNAGTVSFVNQGGKIVKVTVPPLQGVPYVVPLTLVVAVILTFVLSRTRYGRHVYAVGGNPEAARRAGIAVDRVRISVFMIGSLLASIGGVLLASQVRGVDQGEGGGNVLLLAVAAAVVGGTSLFGGKGRASDAVIGGLVLGVIANGMSDLVQGNNGAAVQYIVTGFVLLLAAAVDALARRRASSRGLT